jgi:hypothetical protein
VARQSLRDWLRDRRRCLDRRFGRRHRRTLENWAIRASLERLAKNVGQTVRLAGPPGRTPFRLLLDSDDLWNDDFLERHRRASEQAMPWASPPATRG